MTTLACSAPTGYVSDHTDCNDSAASIHPGAPEICNGLDDDCNGTTEAAITTWNGAGDAINWSGAANGSDGIVPLPCQDVVIPAGNVTIAAAYNSVGKRLDVAMGAVLTVQPAGTVVIHN